MGGCLAADPNKQGTDSTSITPCNRDGSPPVQINGSVWLRDGVGNPVAAAPFFPVSIPLESPDFGCLWSIDYGGGPGVNRIEVRANDPVDGTVTVRAFQTVGGGTHTSTWRSTAPDWWNGTFFAVEASTLPVTILAVNP